MTPAFAKIRFVFLLPIFLSGRPQVGDGGEIAKTDIHRPQRSLMPTARHAAEKIGERSIRA